MGAEVALSSEYTSTWASSYLESCSSGSLSRRYRNKNKVKSAQVSVPNLEEEPGGPRDKGNREQYYPDI